MKKCCRYIEEFKVSGIWNTETTSYASSNGHLDCLKYAHEKGCPWDKYTTRYTTIYGHFDCLKYAHKNGCPWNEQTTLNAVCNGYLDCLKYALENGCPWDVYTGLSELEKYIYKIDLDDKWWRSFLFETDLTSHSILRNLIDTKKEEIKNLQEKTTLLFSYISKDITQYVLWTYF